MFDFSWLGRAIIQEPDYSEGQRTEAQKTKMCHHDWEVVEISSCYYEHWHYTASERTGYTKTSGERPGWGGWHYLFIPVQNKVCLKCGECQDNIKKAKEWVAERERIEMRHKKEQRRRKAWAKQLWKDGCKNETTR